MVEGPEDIGVGDVYLDASGGQWHFTHFNEVVGQPVAMDAWAGRSLRPCWSPAASGATVVGGSR